MPVWWLLEPGRVKCVWTCCGQGEKGGEVDGGERMPCQSDNPTTGVCAEMIMGSSFLRVAMVNTPGVR